LAQDRPLGGQALDGQARAYPKRQEEALKRWNRACSVF
jgi:hypothetical protein